MTGFQRKTIKKVLKLKIKSWLDSIEDFDTQQLAAKNVIVTGGSIASMLLGEPIKDYDVYFKTQEATLAVAKYYVDQFIATKQPLITPEVFTETITNIKGEAEDRVVIKVQSAGIAGEVDTPAQSYEFFEQGQADGSDAEAFFDQFVEADTDKSYRPIFMSQNAISLSNKVQIVIRFYGNPEEIHRNYDFEHCKNWYDYDTNHLELLPAALESLMSKTLRYTGSLYPVCSIFRLRKFIERGWKVSAGEMLKIVWQCTELNLKDPHTLREQLTGVDAAYFHELIAILTDATAKKDINATYVATIIDRVFNT